MKWFNLCENQTIHFDGNTKSPNVDNSFYNRKNIGTTFNARLYAYHPPRKEQTQIERVVIVRRKAQR
jgi:hypothetical protein